MMTGLYALATAATVVLLAAPAAAQPRSYDVIMKEIGATFAALRSEVQSPDLAASVGDAEKLARLFTEVEEFWARFKTNDAIDAARGARDASRAIAQAARGKDAQTAATNVSGLGGFCTRCHGTHREQMPDKTYRIKP